jgi:DNA-binding transcriptional regulator YhcF (GntR family)
MTARASDSLDAWLEPYLERSGHGTALPTQRELATRFNLSERTVARVLQALGKQGRVVRIQGKGSFVRKGDSPLFSSPPTVPGPAWKSVAEALERDIRAGLLGEGTVLPSLKSAALQSGVSTHTVGWAYGRLVGTGLVTRTGRTFRVASIRARMREPRGREITVFIKDDFETSSAQTGSRSLVFAYHTMETLLTRSAYFVRYEVMSNLARRLARWERDMRAPYGMVFMKSSDAELDEVHAAFRASPIRTRLERVPMVFDLDRPSRFAGRYFPGVRLLARPQGAWAIAKAIRDFVRDAGYTQVSCVMPDGPFKATGRLYDFFKVFIECRRLHSPVRFAFVFTEEQHASFRKALPQSNMERILRFHLNFYEPCPFSVFDDHVVVVRRIHDLVDKARAGTLHLFHRDSETAEAVLYARSRNIPVPQRFSALSIESDPRYYHLGLTRCQIDTELLGFQLAHTLMEDLDSSALDGRNLLYHAQVVEKLTTNRRPLLACAAAGERRTVN